MAKLTPKTIARSIFVQYGMIIFFVLSALTLAFLIFSMNQHLDSAVDISEDPQYDTFDTKTIERLKKLDEPSDTQQVIESSKRINPFGA